MQAKLIFFLVSVVVFLVACFSISRLGAANAPKHTLNAKIPLHMRMERARFADSNSYAIIGSSRIENLAYAPSLGNVENLANSGLGILSLRKLIEFIAAETRIRDVYIEIVYYSFQKRFEFNDTLLRTDTNRVDSIADEISADRLSLVVSMMTTKRADMAAALDFQSTPREESIAYLTAFSKEEYRDYEGLEDLSSAVKTCKEAKLNCHFFMGPFHPLYNFVEKRNRRTQLKTFQSFLKEVAAITPFYFLDISVYQGGQYFHNHGHFNVKTGVEMVNRLRAGGFNHLLVDPQNVGSLVAWMEKVSTSVDPENKDQAFLSSVLGKALNEGIPPLKLSE